MPLEGVKKKGKEGFISVLNFLILHRNSPFETIPRTKTHCAVVLIPVPVLYLYYSKIQPLDNIEQETCNV